MPPSQMKTASPTAQRNDVTPWENAGRRIGALDSRQKEIHRAGGAFVPRTHWLSACAYSPQVQLRPTRAPCSVQAAHYAARGAPSRGPQAETIALCISFPFCPVPISDFVLRALKS